MSAKGREYFKEDMVKYFQELQKHWEVQISVDKLGVLVDDPVQCWDHPKQYQSSWSSELLFYSTDGRQNKVEKADDGINTLNEVFLGREAA